MADDKIDIPKELSDYVKNLEIKKTMCHHTLKGVVCCRHLFLGCSRIENCIFSYYSS